MSPFCRLPSNLPVFFVFTTAFSADYSALISFNSNNFLNDNFIIFMIKYEVLVGNYEVTCVMCSF